jgi:hypothetical protein
MQTLHIKTLERVNIADRKFARQLEAPILGRKMSYQEKDDFFNKNSNYQLLKD